MSTMLRWSGPEVIGKSEEVENEDRGLTEVGRVGTEM